MKYFIIMAMTLATVAVVAQDTARTGKRNGRAIRTYEKTMIMDGNSREVFAFMDNIENTGMHMTKENGAMMGSKLTIQWLSDHKTGPGTKYRWTGKVVGMKMDFTVEVSEWAEGKKKVWGTVGDAKMIVIDWFEMYLITSPEGDGRSEAKLGIYYTRHKSLLGFLLGKWYSKWCVKSMLKDTQRHFMNNSTMEKRNQ